MATTTVKATYSIDPGTVSRLEEIARHWGVSKSEALRRAIRAAAAGPDHPAGPLAALDALQKNAALSEPKARAWAAEARRERRAAPSPAGKRRG